MKNVHYSFLYLFFLAGCSYPKETATLFVPNKPTHHLLHKKNDYRVAAGVKMFDFNDEPLISGEFQAAYSPIKHLGILANYSFIAKNLEGFEKRKLHFGEIGLDIYFPINVGERKKHVFELIGGYGLGKSTDFRGATFNGNVFTLSLEDRFYAKSKRAFAQFNYGFKYTGRGKARFSIGPSVRLSKLNIYNIQHISTTRTIQLENPEIDMFGLGVNVETGWRNIQIQYYLFYETPINDEEVNYYEQYIDGAGAIFNIGIGLKTGF